MKTGRLLKFHRPTGDVHAYVYRDVDHVVAAVFVIADGRLGAEPRHRVTGSAEDEVEGEVRAWIDAHFPKQP